MERWRGKIAVVTGASAGIGLEIAKTLINHGIIVVGLARRKEKMETYMKDVKGPGKFYAKQCDITKEDDVTQVFKWITDTFGKMNILVNNAGIVSYKTIADLTNAEIEHTFRVNILGLIACTKAAMELMNKSGEESYIINISSILGHIVPTNLLFPINVYPATKYGLTALAENLRLELKQTQIRVTNISPGLVRSEMYDMAAQAKPELKAAPVLEAEDIAESVIYILGTPKRVEINDIILQAKM